MLILRQSIVIIIIIFTIKDIYIAHFSYTPNVLCKQYFV